MGSYGNKIVSILDVALRVPPVFVVDALFMNGFGGPVTLSQLLQNHLYGQLLDSPPSIDRGHFDGPHTDVPTSNTINSSDSLLDQIFSSFDRDEGFDSEPVTTPVNELPSTIVWITCYMYCEFDSVLIQLNQH